ncbi:MAG: AMP-binding protein [Elusimicrobiota bacterium]
MTALLVRLLLRLLGGLFYRIRAVGRQRVPRSGPVLLVSNHVSFIDAFLISLATRRHIRFLMFRSYYDLPVANWFFQAMGCIPISDRDSPKALIQSFRDARDLLAAGAAVCIFAEGEISRHGQMLRFKRGFERIVEGLDVPIVPVHLDQVWGSIFSFEGGRAIFKKPRRIPYPVTVSFGAPLKASAPAFEVRQAISELGAEAFLHRLESRPPLPIAFFREARRRPLRFKMADSAGRELSSWKALFGAFALGRALEARLGPQEAVGLLLPPSVPAALANLGLALRGKTLVNLNYTATPAIAAGCAEKAGVKHIVTSRKFLEKIGWPEPSGAVYLEDCPPSLADRSLAMLLCLLPQSLAEPLLLGPAQGGLDRTAAVMFTSGSTGVSKGVMLTHANILSNVEAMAQVYAMTGKDRLLGALPFFHCFGFTVTLWFPAVAGFGAVYHANPLDAKRIGDLASRYGATFLLGTPTFLAAYVKRIAPEKLKSLRYAVVGAEKLREDTSKAFTERFGITPLEGYGCTELSPVAAVNIPDLDWPAVKQKGSKPGSIGQALPGVFLKVVDPDTGAALGEGQSGLLLVKGPNVMKGYLGDEEATRRALRDGYYVTGDIAAIDADGFVTITDRLSRFSKIAGEMVPHIRVEEELHRLTAAIEQSFIVAAVPDDKRGERLVVLYKGEQDVDALLKGLAASELPKLWLPAKAGFHRIESFPVLGSGKLDMQALKAEAHKLETAKFAAQPRIPAPRGANPLSP